MSHGRDDGRGSVRGTPLTRVARVPAAGAMVEVELAAPERPAGVVVIVSGTGGMRRRPQPRAMSSRLAEAGWATVLAELLTPAEERLDERTLQLRLDLGLLAGRLAGVLDWLSVQEDLRALPVGLVGGGRGAAVALLTAARRPGAVGAVVSRGLRLGLGSETLSQVTAPTLLISSDQGSGTVDVTGRTARRLGGVHETRVVADADGRHLAPGALDEVLDLSREWFARHLLP